MSALTEKQGRLNHLRGEWRKLYDSKPDMKFTAEEADNLKNWNVEMTDLGAEIETLQKLASIDAELRVKGGTPLVNDAEPEAGEPERVVKSLEQRIREHAGYKAFCKAGGQGTFVFDVAPAELKTLITLSDASPQNARLPRIEPLPVERRTVADLFAQGTIDRNVLEYYEETTLTNSAATVAEGGTKPESALDWTLRTESVSKVATWIPATSEALMDIPWLMSTIQNRLQFMLIRVREAQLLNGDGTAPNISGITDRSGLQTQAKGTDPTPDAILKAANLIRVNSFYEPDAVVIDPLDMQDIRLLRTADGIYIFGSPADPQTAMRLWGLEIRETTAQTDNTALVGAFGTAAQVFYRTGITITVSTEHSTYFVENKVAVLAEQRLGLAVYRPNAFCTVTGI